MNRDITPVYVRLSNTQIIQDFFSATQDGIELLRPPEHLDVLAHTGSSKTSSTEDLEGNGCSAAQVRG